VSDTPGFSQAIAGVIAELRLARVEPETVGIVAPDIALIIHGYEAELRSACLTDWAGVLELATEALRASNPHRLIRLPTLLLDVAVRCDAELVFVAGLVAVPPDALLTIPAANVATRRRVTDRLKMKVEELDPTDQVGAPLGALARLQRYLFN